MSVFGLRLSESKWESGVHTKKERELNNVCSHVHTRTTGIDLLALVDCCWGHFLEEYT